MRKYLIGGVAALALIIAGYLVFDALVFRAVSSNPSQNGDANYAQDISVRFNRDLDSSTLKGIKISPYVEGKFSLSGKDVIFRPSTSLKIGEKYSLTIVKPRSTKGDELGSFVLKFKIKYKGYTDLSKEEKDRVNKQTDSLEKKQPLVQYLPHEESHFKIDYTVNPDSSLNINVTTYAILNRPEQQAAFAQTTSQYRNEANKFITDHGFKLSDYKVTYKPTLSTDPPSGGEPTGGD